MAAFLLLPWLSPYTAGPTPNVWPWLLSAFCAVVLWLFRRRLDPELVVIGWVLAAVVSALIGLIQYFGLAPLLSPWINQPQAGEAYANLRQRNQFATLTSIGLAALIGWLALREQPDQRQQQPTQGWLMPWWAYLIAWLLALGNAASSSRTGMMQLGLLAALWLLWGGWRQPAVRRVLLTTLVVYGVATVALPWLAGLDFSTQGALARLRAGDSLCASRLTLWSNVLHLIAQKPWLGWGWGELDYAHFITLYQGPRFCAILDNAHNLPLQLAVELGVPAAAAIFGALGWLTWRARPWRETDPLRQMAWAVLAVIGLHSLLEYPLWYGPFQMAAVLAAWLLFASREAKPGLNQEFSSKFKQNSLFAQYLRALIATIMIVTLAAVAVSYYRVSQIYLPPDQRSAAYRDGTLAKVQGSWLFRDQARFAYLSITPLTPGNAAALHAMAIGLLHYSPEPRVIEKLIESAVMLGRNDEALYYLMRYRAAFPNEHARWVQKNSAPLVPGVQGRPQALLNPQQALPPVHPRERRSA